MRSRKMIETIEIVERELHGMKDMYKSRIKYFQNQNKPIMLGVEYDSSFYNFKDKLEYTLGGSVREITAKKILNNWYIWAVENLIKLKSTPKFVSSDNPIDFLLDNDFRIDIANFAKVATNESVDRMKEKIKKNSSLHLKLKEKADKVLYPNGTTKGISYDYLIKAVTGFVDIWD